MIRNTNSVSVEEPRLGLKAWRELVMIFCPENFVLVFVVQENLSFSYFGASILLAY